MLAQRGSQVNNRRKLIVAMGATTLAMPLASLAQKKPAKVYRIGFITPSNLDSPLPHLHEAFTQGLRELGYVEGQNVIIERRFGNIERLPVSLPNWCA